MLELTGGVHGLSFSEPPEVIHAVEIGFWTELRVIDVNQFVRNDLLNLPWDCVLVFDGI